MCSTVGHQLLVIQFKSISLAYQPLIVPLSLACHGRTSDPGNIGITQMIIKQCTLTLVAAEVTPAACRGGKQVIYASKADVTNANPNPESRKHTTYTNTPIFAIAPPILHISYGRIARLCADYFTSRRP